MTESPTRSQRLAGPARTVAATLGILVALAGIWLSAESQRETKHATQLGLLTQLDEEATRAEYDVNASTLIDSVCEGEGLKAEEQARVDNVLQHYEYFAWLVNSGQLDRIPGVREYWMPRIVEAEDLGEHLIGRESLRDQYKELWQFRANVPPADQPPDACTPG